MKSNIRGLKVNRGKKARCGAALVEAALVLPIFFLAVTGIIVFGRAMMVAQIITNATREGARQAVLDGSTNSGIESEIQTDIANSLGIPASDVTVVITLAAGSQSGTPPTSLQTAGPKDLITINTSVPYDSVTFVPGTWLAGARLSAQTTMRHE